MKDSQWTIAVIVLAALVFVAVFVGQYLGTGTGARPSPGSPGKGADLELVFEFQMMPTPLKRPGPDGKLVDVMVPVETEEKERSFQDFYFVNDKASAVKVGPKKIGCTCSDISVFVVPGDGKRWIAASAAALLAAGSDGVLGVAATHAATLATLEKSSQQQKWLNDKDTTPAEVPAGAAGWVRLAWKANRHGGQALEAVVWMDTTAGKQATLRIMSYAFDPVRVQPELEFGSVRDFELGKGRTHHLIVWSSTRPNLEVRAASTRGEPQRDAFVVGSPESLPLEERKNLQMDFNGPGARPDMKGPVLSAFRIPVTLYAMAPDGKTPVELGPFERAIVITSPALPHGESKTVFVRGRVRGIVELGTDDRAGGMSLGSFSGKIGKREKLALTSDTANLELRVDTARTAKFLKATLDKPEEVGGRRVWSLGVTALPGEVRGAFPRRHDPAFEDSAVYLEAKSPDMPPRTIRIPVYGTATER